MPPQEALYSWFGKRSSRQTECSGGHPHSRMGPDFLCLPGGTCEFLPKGCPHLPKYIDLVLKMGLFRHAVDEI